MQTEAGEDARAVLFQEHEQLSRSDTETTSQRVVLVTGAAGALGSAISRRLVGDGAVVVRADRDGDPSSVDLAFDVAQPEQWDDAVQQVESRWGPLGGLVLAHGVVGAEAPVGDYPLDAWRQVVDVNLTACFIGLSATMPKIAANGGGHVVAIASITAREPNANQSAYSASKAGLISLIKTASREYATRGVLINAISPGVIDTPMAARLSDDLRREILAKVPMKRFGLPAEVAAIASFLMSPELSYTTGQVFDVSGGRAAV